jgi:hypothetical protein
MRILCCFVLLIGPCVGQSLGDTDLEAYRLIQRVRDFYQRYQMRDPATLEQIRQTPMSFEQIDIGKKKAAKQYVVNMLGTYYDSYDLSNFRVVFISKDEATVTFYGIIVMRGFGKRAVKSSIFTDYLKRSESGWVLTRSVIVASR